MLGSRPASTPSTGDHEAPGHPLQDRQGPWQPCVPGSPSGPPPLRSSHCHPPASSSLMMLILTGVPPGPTKLAPSETSAPRPARSLPHRLMAVAAGTHGPSLGEGLAGLQKGSDQGTQESGGLGLPPPHRHGHLGSSEPSSPSEHRALGRRANPANAAMGGGGQQAPWRAARWLLLPSAPGCPGRVRGPGPGQRR